MIFAKVVTNSLSFQISLIALITFSEGSYPSFLCCKNEKMAPTIKTTGIPIDKKLH
jgi:hypothetical protein